MCYFSFFSLYYTITELKRITLAMKLWNYETNFLYNSFCVAHYQINSRNSWKAMEEHIFFILSPSSFVFGFNKKCKWKESHFWIWLELLFTWTFYLVINGHFFFDFFWKIKIVKRAFILNPFFLSGHLLKMNPFELSQKAFFSENEMNLLTFTILVQKRAMFCKRI